MSATYDDTRDYALSVRDNKTLRNGNGIATRWSEITVASLRASGLLDNMVDGTTPPANNLLWLDKNFDPAVLKEWDPVGLAWVKVTSQTLFGRLPFRGDWQSTAIYRKGDLVSYGGVIWIATLSSQNHTPVDDASWDKFIDGVAVFASAAQGAKADTALQPDTGATEFMSKAAAASAVIPSVVSRISTKFYAPNLVVPATLKGGANYRRSTSAEVANYPARGWLQSLDGAYWLLDEKEPNAHQFGGLGDGVTDDLLALQALLDFWCPAAQMASGTVTSRPVAMSGGGPVHIPKGVWRHTKTLYQNAFVAIRGDGQAMFPQAPVDASTYGQYAFPQTTILRPDLIFAERALGVGIQTSPYVLKSGGSAGLSGQTVGTRFKSLNALEISGTDIDNGFISYCEGATIENLTVWPVNEIFASYRWTAAAASKLVDVGARNCQRGIMSESCWESRIENARIFDFKTYGIYGGGNLHAVAIIAGWIHAGGRVLAGDKPTGIYATYFTGLVIEAIAIDECWDTIYLQSGHGCVINGIHSERTKNVFLRTNQAFGVVGSGNAMVQNTVDARTFDNSIIWDGNNCDVDINVTVSVDGVTPGTHPGYTIAPDTNPNTGQFSDIHYAVGNKASVTFRGMKPVSKERTRVNRLNGNIRFLNDEGEVDVGGQALGNQYLVNQDLYGDSGVARYFIHKVNGAQKFYDTETATGIITKADTTNKTLFGFDIPSNTVMLADGGFFTTTFGSPNTFKDGQPGTICVDTQNYKLYIKTSAAGTLTGWVVVGTQT